MPVFHRILGLVEFLGLDSIQCRSSHRTEQLKKNPRGGGGQALNKVLYEEAAPEGSTGLPFNY